MSVEVGQKVSGKVTGITNFGAFVSLPENKSGLVHISEVSDGFVKDINDILSVGDEVTVKVLKITPDGKINLSIRKANEQEQPDQAASRPAPSRDKKPSDHKGQSHSNKGSYSKPNHSSNSRPQQSRSNNSNNSGGNDFDSLMNQFLKDSEDNLSSLRRNTEGKRGGRGGRRN
ncbi:S1 domain-containing RNA-binding protein [Ruoffia tabacinasalis]|uniref:RNA-binding protein S1 n=1 Tax=Ruoffia tabacinasalis TaxID=87458 RepID=A0ABS0LJD0_9LACT|nr:S1 domain-containing RNA-binding protein [Ruoffia tabacinasalis]MBG9977531.1 RNA-binding protein S1 [Ruoffia tabacinasalis]